MTNNNNNNSNNNNNNSNNSRSVNTPAKKEQRSINGGAETAKQPVFLKPPRPGQNGNRE
jgi:hypothetical protein